MYSCYEGDGFDQPECEADPSERRKVVILGGGPNRIGQGIEFDYCCVHAAYSLSEAGIETIMVNCNPETVSTDYDTSDRLYFEPLTAEDVIEIVRVEQRRGRLLGVIVQFGGQTPLKLAAALERARIPILGTSPDAIDLAEDRRRFQGLLTRLGLRQPENGTAYSAGDAEAVALRIGYPVVIRPSYVLGGRAMEIVHDPAGLNRYMRHAVSASGTSPVLIDRYLQDAIEVDVDAIADGIEVEVAGIMEHIEEAGIHSGDSACSLPPYSLDAGDDRRNRAADRGSGPGAGCCRADECAVRGQGRRDLCARGQSARLAHGAVRRQGDRRADRQDRGAGDGRRARSRDCRGARPKRGGHVAVKEAVFPFARFPGVDLILGPEMKSTGEVMGLDADFGRAFAKSQLASGTILPLEGCVFVSVRDRDKEALVEPCRRLVEMGFRAGRDPRHRRQRSAPKGLPVTTVNKVRDGRPHVVDHMLQRRGPAGVQHHRGQPGDRRQLQPQANGAHPCDPILHDRRRRAGGGPGDRGVARREP